MRACVVYVCVHVLCGVCRASGIREERGMESNRCRMSCICVQPLPYVLYLCASVSTMRHPIITNPTHEAQAPMTHDTQWYVCGYGILTYMHTYMHRTYIHTYMHTYIHTYMPS